MKKVRTDITYAIKLIEPGFRGVFIGWPDAMLELSDKLMELSISHHIMFDNHPYFWTPFGIQEHL